MKTVSMIRDFHYTPKSDRRVTFSLLAGHTYYRVLDAAAAEIARAGAGRIIDDGNRELTANNEWTEPMAVDSGPAWRFFGSLLKRR